MKILIYDSNLESLEYLYSLLKKVSIVGLKIDKCIDKEEFLNLFNSNSYEKIFVDFCEGEGTEIISMINKAKPEQELYMINGEYECIEEKDCMFCFTEYNRKSLIKPYNFENINSVVKEKNFKCEKFMKNKSDFKLYKLQKCFNKEHLNIKLNHNKEKKEITTCPYSKDIFDNLVEVFKEYELNFDILNDRSLQVNL